MDEHRFALLPIWQLIAWVQVALFPSVATDFALTGVIASDRCLHRQFIVYRLTDWKIDRISGRVLGDFAILTFTSMISFRQFSLRRGGRLLLSQVDLTIYAGQRVGLVGSNGAGKSSLFAAIEGRLDGDCGELERPKQVRMASVAQETRAETASALEFVLGGDEPVADALRLIDQTDGQTDWDAVAVAHQMLSDVGGYEARARASRLLDGLGFLAHTHHDQVSTFSGGWRMRLNLARALMQPSDLLLLDEPTNHLDIDAVLLLEHWLLRYRGTVLFISHDREFLDHVATHIVLLHDQNARLYPGNYSDFERQRAEQQRQQQLQRSKVAAERDHLQHFIDRFRATASKARQAQSRLKRLEKLATLPSAASDKHYHLRLPAPEQVPHTAISLRDVDAGYAHQAPILRQLTIQVEAGDRVGLLGANGAGKSTLIKTLIGQLPVLAGERHQHPATRIGYFAQHTLEALALESSSLDHLRAYAPNASQQALRDFLGQWGFGADHVMTPVGQLSGGERTRLALALLAWQCPNVVLLDEPTNHLDIAMREALADALNAYSGAVVIVSHDRHLLGLVCETFWHVSDGTIAPFDGDLEAYSAWLASRAMRDGPSAMQPNDQSGPTERAKQRCPPRKPANAVKLAEAEERVYQLEQELTAIDAQLIEPHVLTDHQRLRALTQQRETLAARLADAETIWLQRMDESSSQ